jgi:molecular chaperone GrpE
MSDQDNKQSGPKNKWSELTEREQGVSESEAEAVKEEQPASVEGLTLVTRQQLEDQLTAMERSADNYKEKAIRVHAEMDNLRKRTERDMANAIKFGTEKLIADLLPIVDSLVRGLDSPESQDPHAKSMCEGMGLTLDLLHKTLIKHGVQLIDPKRGDTFNPVLHEAVSLQKTPGAKPNTIVQVMQKGYQLNDRILRAAIVVVAAA